MKLNQECIRDLLLETESKLELDGSIGYKDIEQLDLTKKYNSNDIIYVLQKLNEAGFLKVRFYQSSSTSVYSLSIDSITWEGHKFLDTIRDNTVWSDTKNVVSKFSSVSITMISDIASNVISQIINKQLGF